MPVSEQFTQIIKDEGNNRKLSQQYHILHIKYYILTGSTTVLFPSIESIVLLKTV